VAARRNIPGLPECPDDLSMVSSLIKRTEVDVVYSFVQMKLNMLAYCLRKIVMYVIFTGWLCRTSDAERDRLVWVEDLRRLIIRYG
jgi:hypothetical protein